MSAVVMNKRARRAAHTYHPQPPILLLQTEREKGQAELDECGTLQDILGSSFSISGIMGSPQAAFFQFPESFAIPAISEYGNILLNAEQFNEMKRALAAERGTNAYLVSSRNL